MKLYALSLGAGLLVGILYSLLSVRSPAPPLIALVGLLGILVGEQVVPVGKRLLGSTVVSAPYEQHERKSQATGPVPGQWPNRDNAGSVSKESQE